MNLLSVWSSVDTANIYKHARFQKLERSLIKEHTLNITTDDEKAQQDFNINYYFMSASIKIPTNRELLRKK